MKRKKNCVKVSRQLLPPDYYLPDDCWELIFKYLNDEEKRYSLKCLSLVSKQWLSMTNRFHLSLNIYQPTLQFLPRLLQRFTNLSSLNFSLVSCNLNKVLPQISRFPLNITLLNISNKNWLSFSAYGLRIFSKNIKTLTSLTCSHVYFDYYNDLFFIADCFPLLQILNISYTDLENMGRSGVKLREFPKLEVLNLSHTGVDDQQLFIISKACPQLLLLSLNSCEQVTENGVKHVLENCTQLREINIAWCYEVHPSIVASMIFSRPSLTKITAPPGCILSDTEKELFKLQGCLIC